jgi:hypothetical protein
MTIVAPLINLWGFASAVELESPFSGASFNGAAAGYQKLASDPIGVFTLTLTNVVIGSRIHIETQGDGTTLHDSVADATDETITLSAYASGSPYNALRIKVRKGTGSPTYKPFETLATAIVGAQSIYVGQIADE